MRTETVNTITDLVRYKEEKQRKQNQPKTRYRDYKGSQRIKQYVFELTQSNPDITIETVKHKVMLDQIKESYIQDINLNEAVQYSSLYGKSDFQVREIFQTILQSKI